MNFRNSPNDLWENMKILAVCPFPRRTLVHPGQAGHIWSWSRKGGLAKVGLWCAAEKQQQPKLKQRGEEEGKGSRGEKRRAAE